MAYHIEWRDHGVHIHQYGNVDLDDMAQMQREGYRHPRIDTIKYILWDGTLIDRISLKPLEIKMVASQDIGASCWKRNILHASVGKTEDVEQICIRYIDILRATVPSWKSQHFESVDEAEAWIHSNLRAKGRLNRALTQPSAI